MTHIIKEENCQLCNSCVDQCPQDAIKANPQKAGYWIDPTLCDGCPDVDVPRCVGVCDEEALIPLQAKKGRYKSTLLPAAISTLFITGKANAFASSMVMWEACNVLAQRQSLPWQADEAGLFSYHRSVNHDRGKLQFHLDGQPEEATFQPMPAEAGAIAIGHFDIRAACIHLIFAAYITTLDCPWQETFVLNDQHIEHYLGLDKRRDLTKLEKLTLIKELVHQVCRLLVSIEWPRQGKVAPFSVEEHAIWQLLDTQYFFETTPEGYRHLIGLNFQIKAGIWAKYFLNKQDYRRQTAFYQYGTLPHSLLLEVMSHWQQHEGAMRLLLWLLFKLRIGAEHRMTVRTLLKIAYGEERLMEAMTVRGAHKRLLKSFEKDLETLSIYGLNPIFDPETYPLEIQPLWVRVAQIPEGADDALEFWADDANLDMSLTDAAPRDKWQRLLNARLLGFELSEEWQHTIRRAPQKKRRAAQAIPPAPQEGLSSQVIKTARQHLKLSQRALADRLGKSQSWIRDVEKGRFLVSSADQERLRQVLQLPHPSS